MDENGNMVFVQEEPRISTAVLLAYVNLKASLIFGDLAVGVAISVYLEVMRLNIAALAMVRALAKSIDLLVSFVIGFVSDNLQTPYGRRLPFILVGSVVAPFAMWFLATPPEEWSPSALPASGRQLHGTGTAARRAVAEVDAAAGSAPAGLLPFDEVCTSELAEAALYEHNSANCSALARCLEAAISAGVLASADGGVGHASSSASPAAAERERTELLLALWFLFFFVLRHSVGHTLVSIPYDALGQELTSDSESRQRLFAWKSLFNFGGLLSAYIIQVACAIFLATNLSLQAQTVAGVGAFMMLASCVWLLSFVREKAKASASKSRPSVPFLATMYALASNGPYLNYLSIRLWLTLAFHLPFFTRMNYLKYVVGFENAALASTVSAFAAQLSSFYSLPIMMAYIKRRGKVTALMHICLCALAFATMFALISRRSYKHWRLYCLQPLVEGVTQVALYTIPEWMLADVIDYDELTHGTRREGIFVVFDVNIMQLMDIIAGVIPGILLGAVGYIGNAGCRCGCGVECPAEFMRWSCPADVGYSCSTKLSDANPPFFGEAKREPPCTFQAEGVLHMLQLHFFVAPAVCFALATFFALRNPFRGEAAAQVQEQLALRSAGQKELYDPISNEVVHFDETRSLEDLHVVNIIDSFSAGEQRLMVEEDGLRRLQWRVGLNLLLAIVAMVGVSSVPKLLQLPRVFSSIAVFVSSLFLLLIVWQALKLATALQSASEISIFANAVHFEGQGAGSRDAAPSSLRFGSRGRLVSQADIKHQHVEEQHAHAMALAFITLEGKIGEAGLRRVSNLFIDWAGRAMKRRYGAHGKPRGKSGKSGKSDYGSSSRACWYNSELKPNARASMGDLDDFRSGARSFTRNRKVSEDDMNLPMPSNYAMAAKRREADAAESKSKQPQVRRSRR